MLKSVIANVFRIIIEKSENNMFHHNIVMYTNIFFMWLKGFRDRKP